MTRERLFGLSKEELGKIAERVGIQFSKEIEKETLVELIIEEEEESRRERESLNNNPMRFEEKKYSFFLDEELDDSDSDIHLPRRYNETKIIIMLRDPAWAYAYWDIKDSDLKEISPDPKKIDQVLLRVNEFKGPDTNGEVIDSFDIPVKQSDNRWYLNLGKQDTYYYLDLICIFDGKEYLLARSNIIRVPRGWIAGNQDNISITEDKIMALSGIDNIGVSTFGNRIPQRIISLLDEN